MGIPDCTAGARQGGRPMGASMDEMDGWIPSHPIHRLHPAGPSPKWHWPHPPCWQALGPQTRYVHDGCMPYASPPVKSPTARDASRQLGFKCHGVTVVMYIGWMQEARQTSSARTFHPTVMIRYARGKPVRGAIDAAVVSQLTQRVTTELSITESLPFELPHHPSSVTPCPLNRVNALRTSHVLILGCPVELCRWTG